MATSETSLASLMTRVVSDLAYLLQTEIRLARAEIAEKLETAANGGMLIGIAAVLLLPGLFLTFLAAVSWLEYAGIPERWALLLVAALATLTGVVLALKGASNLKASALMPDRTINQVRADLGIAKEQVS